MRASWLDIVASKCGELSVVWLAETVFYQAGAVSCRVSSGRVQFFLVLEAMKKYKKVGVIFVLFYLFLLFFVGFCVFVFF